jgi:hypothetical protein
MNSFFRSKLARELASLIRNRRGLLDAVPSLRDAEPEPVRDDLEYYTDRHSKQMKLAEQAATEAAREAHMKMARLYRAKASEALRVAMRHNRDALHLSLMDLPTDRNHEIEALLEREEDQIKPVPAVRSIS